MSNPGLVPAARPHRSRARPGVRQGRSAARAFDEQSAVAVEMPQRRPRPVGYLAGSERLDERPAREIIAAERAAGFGVLDRAIDLAPWSVLLVDDRDFEPELGAEYRSSHAGGPARRLRTRPSSSVGIYLSPRIWRRIRMPGLTLPHLDHAALAVRDAVDLGKAVEARSHHAIGGRDRCPRPASGECWQNRRQASPRQLMSRTGP
jgi:hypothetical protein